MSKRRITIHTAIKQRVPPGSKVLIGVSGGRDSMALTHGLLYVSRLLSVHLEVCHVDHRLRSGSEEDARFVESWCQERGVLCHVVRLEERPAGQNVEAWARQQRYAAFHRVMTDQSLDVLCTAHTANDVGETLLMRLIANKELRSIEEFDPRRRCVRPLIEISREQIDEYVNEFSLQHVEDPTNQDTNFVRNRVRHELLPLLANRFDPSIVWTLSERARSLAADSDALEAVASSVAERLSPIQEGSVEWLEGCRVELGKLPVALQWRVIQIVVRPLVGYTVGETKARSILDALMEETSILQLASTMRLRVSRAGVFIET